MPGSEVFMLQKTQEANGTTRALVSDSPLASAPPLGWVTMVKDGVPFLTDIE